jgi:hypothetical protein
MPRLKSKYNEQVRRDLQAQLGIDNVMQIPKIEKIVINMGVGRAAQQASLLEAAVADLDQVDRWLQAARRTGHRLQGDAARRPHVGVPRPLGRSGDPTYP